MSISLLIVDDSAFIRKVFHKQLAKLVNKILGEATNGKEGIEMYKELKPNIVLIDLHMPVMDGIQALQRIIKWDKDAKIIVVSTLGQEKLIKKALELGVIDYIRKSQIEHDLTEVLVKIRDSIFFTTAL